MKYIVLKVGERELPVIFPNEMVHADVAAALKGMDGMAGASALSAGELSSLCISPKCHGSSDTLRLGSRGKRDDRLIASLDYTHGLV